MAPAPAPPTASEPRPRLLADVLAAGAPYSLALTGDYAVQAHGLGGRVGQDLEVATESGEDMARIVAVLRAGLWERGWQAGVSGAADSLTARLIVTDPDDGEAHGVGVLKELLWRRPVPTGFGLALSLEDVVGTKVRALADHGLPRDLIDIRAAADRWTAPELEELGRRHTRDGTLDLADLRMRLTGMEWIDDTLFTAYGLDTDAVGELRGWAQGWADDIGERLLEGGDPEEDAGQA
ncbi:nucleotidyl transferase AbiEii/AbiGii toxin family protein [Streptomyces sp. NPDC005648]|uniref:nucleotidyl transferase AbiEii/AbiGii toxin family protein n=1 Tax=Streptomyces sp. NPDC005648 TaxID=3157044 RepID=UPI0033AF6E45